MKKTLLAVASIALVSSVAFSAHAADIDPIKVRSVQAVGGYQKIDKILIKKADDVSISQQNAHVNVDVESSQLVGKTKIDIAALGIVAGIQDIDKIKLDNVNKVTIAQTQLGVGVNLKYNK